MEDSKQEEKSQPPKLKAFEKFQEDFATVGITPDSAAQSCPLNGTIFGGFLLIGSANYFVLEYIIFDAEKFDEYTQTVYTVAIQTIILFALIILILSAEKIFEFINDGNDLVNTTLKYSPSQSIFSKTMQFERKLSKIIFFVIIKMTPVCVFMPHLIHIYFIYFTTDLGTDEFNLMSPISFNYDFPNVQRLPFDWKNPFGFLLAITWQCIVILYISMIGLCITNLSIGSFLYVTASIKCIKGSLFSIRRSACVKTNPNILEQFIEFIQFYLRVKQWVTKYTNILRPVLTLILIWILATICGVLLTIQMSHHSDDLSGLLIAIQTFYAFGILFVACELGQRVNLAFAECGDMFDQLKWYLFPAEIQRMLPMVLSFTQQPIEIKWFGSIKSDRETFKYVINTSFKYSAILREFYF